jgi:hypothetical protein
MKENTGAELREGGSRRYVWDVSYCVMLRQTIGREKKKLEEG